MAMAMQATDYRTKMVIIRVTGRKEEVHSWATGDHFAYLVMGKCIATDADPKADYYWRIAKAGEIKALDAKKVGKKLPGW